MRCKLFCKHDFSLVTTYKSDADKSVGFKLQEYFVVYCPKCRLQKTMDKLSYDIMIKKKEIDEQHAKNERARKPYRDRDTH